MLLCTPRNFRSRKRPCCHDLDHFLLVLIATLSVHSILRIYVTGVTAIHPIYIQAVSSQTLTATCLEGPDRNCHKNSEDDDWKENMRSNFENWKNWKVKVLHLLMCWKLLWNIVMKRVHGRLQHWYRDIIGWDLWHCIGVCYVVGKQPGRGGQPPWCLDLRTKNLWFDANFWCPGHFWCDWIGAWLPLQARISQISWISPIITVWILWIRFDSGNVTFFMRGFAPASMAETSPATLAFTFMPRGQDEKQHWSNACLWREFFYGQQFYDGVCISICKIDINQ